MPVYRKTRTEADPEVKRNIPQSVFDRAVEKETLQWLYDNASRFEEKYGLPKGILLPLAGHESAHYQKAIPSGTGPKGLFQISRGTGRALGLQINDLVDERLDLEKATDTAAKLLAQNLKSQGGDVAKALAMYNGGGAAADYVDGRTHLYDSNNGNPGELYGFMRGVANYAREWGNNDLYDTLAPTYKDRRDEILEMKKKLIADGNEIPLDGSWGKKTAQLWSAYEEKNSAPAAPYVPGKGMERREFPEMKEPDNYVERPAPKKVEPKKPVASSPEKKKRDPNEIRIYKNGGMLFQTANGQADVPLQGEERVYSIPDTKKMVDRALKAETPEQLTELGKFFYQATKKQDERKPEYTES